MSQFTSVSRAAGALIAATIVLITVFGAPLWSVVVIVLALCAVLSAILNSR